MDNLQNAWILWKPDWSEVSTYSRYYFLFSKYLPQNSDDLSFRWATEFIIQPMLQNPHNCSYNKEEYGRDNPHLYGKWLKESPCTRVYLLHWSHYDEPRFNKWLSKIRNSCSACDNCNVTYDCIKLLQESIHRTINNTNHIFMNATYIENFKY